MEIKERLLGLVSEVVNKLFFFRKKKKKKKTRDGLNQKSKDYKENLKL